ncbi:hypothetical protein GJU39_18285 [Pedobacter petrophilus]|uniref:HTTM-like domain-containing protein n=1 Tax=Pedobacter petrophilus TaxID=1908241 RepID=A0A7K0G332_9SPHI|nr:HTTM domain-containing protein [Pedobacter petrophilus]MRX78032.1 hypothetical protein [Pedobacter petrophilus]
MELKLKPSESYLKQLSFFRVIIALFCIFQAMAIYPNLLELYGANGMINSEIGDAFISNVLIRPNIQNLYPYLSPYLSAELFSYLVFYIYVLFLLLLTVGYRVRLFSALSWLFHLILINSALHFNYGVEQFTKICLFYCVIMPTGYFAAISKKVINETKNDLIPFISVKILQFHLCIVYFFGGLGKIKGTHWLNGEAIWRSIEQPQFQQFDMSWIAAYPLVLKLLGLFVVFIEISYPIFVNIKKMRGIHLILVIILHLNIAIFMGLRYFAAIMILFNLSAYGYSYLSAFSHQFINRILSVMNKYKRILKNVFATPNIQNYD